MLHHFCDVKFQAVESVRHLTEQVFHLLLQDSELPVKVDAALALQFLVKYQVLCEWEGGGAVEGLVGGVLGRECYLGGVCICCDTVMRDTTSGEELRMGAYQYASLARQAARSWWPPCE